MKSTSNIAIKLSGILLLTAAVLKVRQLLTEPMANNDIWTSRIFLIFTVEFEIAPGNGNTQMAREGNAPSWEAINENINMVSAKKDVKEVMLLCSR